MREGEIENQAANRINRNTLPYFIHMAIKLLNFQTIKKFYAFLRKNHTIHTKIISHAYVHENKDKEERKVKKRKTSERKRILNILEAYVVA